MNILNKRTIIIATASLLCFAGSHVCLAKPAAGAASHMQRGIELAQQKNFDAAIAEFTKAIEANPKDPLGYTNRATAYRASSRFAEAVADYTKAIEISTKDHMAFRERGNTQVMQKQYDLALPDWEKAIELKPD